MGYRDRGVPLEKVFEKITRARVTNPFEITCTENSDCKTYKVTNQCRIYCGNTSISNSEVQTSLAKNRVCDPSSWREPAAKCVCVHGSCVDLF